MERRTIRAKQYRRPIDGQPYEFDSVMVTVSLGREASRLLDRLARRANDGQGAMGAGVGSIPVRPNGEYLLNGPVEYDSCFPSPFGCRCL